jgi:DNA-binding CsgD family transcriptional regulator/tetratricopeptide (TPR) repeat protein
MAFPGRPAFVARSDDLARLRAAHAEALASRTRTVLLGGEAGVGKSRLVEAFSAQAVEQGGLAAIAGSPANPEGDLPFALIVGLIRAVGRAIGPAEAETVIGPAGPALQMMLQGSGGPAGGAAVGGRTGLFEAVLGMVERLAESRAGAILVLEDLQWADRSSRELLSYLAHSLRDVGILIIGTYRSDELPPGHPLRVQLAELDRSSRVERWELRRLTPDEVRQLLESVRGAAVPDALAARVAARSDGNAYYAEELARSMADGQDELPVTLRDILRARIAGLPPGVDQLLRLCAVAGRRWDQRLIELMVDAGPAELGAVLRDAAGRGLLVLEREGDRELVAFRQTLVWETVYEDLVGSERRRLHAVIANTLEAHRELIAGPPAIVEGEIARHWLGAGLPVPARAALVRAGRAAEAAFAFPEAALAYDQSLALWDAADQVSNDGAPVAHQLGFQADRTDRGSEPDHGLPAGRATVPDWADVVRRAAEAHSLSGNAGRAVELIERLFAASATGTAATDWLRLGRYVGETGELERSLSAYRRASELAADDRRLVARIAASRAGALIGAGRYREARMAAEEAISAAHEAGSDSILQSGRQMLGVALSMEGDLDAGLAELAEARRLAATADHASVVMPRPSRIHDVVREAASYALVMERAGRPTEVALTAREGVHLARQYGVEDTLGAQLALVATRHAFLTGAWDVADRDSRGLLEQPRDRATDARLQLLRAQLAVGRGAFDDAAAHLELAAPTIARLADPSLSAELAATNAELAIWRRQLMLARQTVEDAIRALDQAEDRVPIITLAALGLRAEADLAELARARRAVPEAAESARVGAALRAEVVALTRRLGDRTVASPRELRVMSAVAEAEWTRLDGRSDPDAWDIAVARAVDVREPWTAAYAGWRAAEARLASRDGRERAERALASAFRSATELAATALLDEIAGLARRARIDLGGRDTVEGAPPAPPSARDTLGLSERELEVLGLVAEGYTNRRIAEALFITEKTASHHVSNVIGKLGVSTRVEAAALAHRLGLLDGPKGGQ